MADQNDDFNHAFPTPTATSTSVSSTRCNSISRPATFSSCSTPYDPSDLSDSVYKLSLGADEADGEFQPCLAKSNVRIDTLSNRFASFVCAFGFTGELPQPPPVPEDKAAFLKTVQVDLCAVRCIQGGFQSYVKAICGDECQTFGDDFVDHELQATAKTVEQLEVIKKHLLCLKATVEGLEHDDDMVDDDFKTSYSHARPWIARARAILVEAHVFYKVNYVLAGEQLV